ncbi:hypothetical protein LPB140_10055 [Sphingorhabdus lutea]|uniref:Ribosomal protein L11 methyltransferase n=2 Tax=Sphingorhabdus lutea TaxID=1913578 RepID=A0A1L3JF57_9SPHN|nr:hypothetical protein LPB140_10055 [Sphingorhabdus lutea]
MPDNGNNPPLYSYNEDESGSWKCTINCSRIEAQAIADFDDIALFFDETPTIVARETVPDDHQSWVAEFYLNSEIKPEQVAVFLSNILPEADLGHDVNIIFVPHEDWVTLSQQGMEPLHIGRFYVHDSNCAPSQNPQIRNFEINASQAFGTGHHETTAGCLQQIDNLSINDASFSNIADIGTGTGLLAFAAQHLWPQAHILASDIDPIAIDMAARFAAANDIHIGEAAGQLSLCVASGTDHPQIMGRAPYDLLIANILAGPLVELAPAFANIAATNGSLILAGLLNNQSATVIAEYEKYGFQLVSQHANGDWPTLMFKRILQNGVRETYIHNGKTSQTDGDYGEW